MNSAGLKSRRTALVCLLLAAATLTVYWQVSGFEFTNFDEFQMMLSNPYVLGGLTLHGFAWALTTSWFEYWHPLTWLSHMLDCELFGVKPGVAPPGQPRVPYRQHPPALPRPAADDGQGAQPSGCRRPVFPMPTSTLDTSASCEPLQPEGCAPGFWPSAMVAALFALHPLHVESVAWIAERKDVLSAFFFFLTLWAYVRYVEIQSPRTKVQGPSPASSIRHPLPRITHHASRYYALSLVFFACGLMSKPMVVTLPFVLLLLDYWPLERIHGCGPQTTDPNPREAHHASRFTFHVSRITLLPLLVEKLPFFALTAASCVITYLGVKAGGSILSTEAVPWSLRLANVPVSYVRYLGKLFWPTDLIALYPMPSHWAGWQVGGAVIVLVLISLFVVLRARTAPYLIVGWLFFLGVLFPTIGIVQAGFQSIADRYTYIPAIGIFIAVVWGVAEWGKNHRWTQMDTDTNELREHTRIGDGQPQPAKDAGCLGQSDFASISAIRGSEPITPLLRPFPNLSSSVSIGGSVLPGGLAVAALVLCGYLTWIQVGTWRNSTTLWTHCLAVCPDNLVAHYNLGYILQHSNKTGEAIAQYRAALRLKPDHVDANLNLGIALIASGRAQEATNYLAAALRAKPGYGRAEGAMGLALYELRDYAGAVSHCGEAIRLDPDTFGPYVDMGRALSAQGRSDDALRYYAEGLRLNPGLPQTHYYLGLEWMKRGAFDEAAASFGEAVRLAPTWGEARAQQQRALKEANKPQDTDSTDAHR